MAENYYSYLDPPSPGPYGGPALPQAPALPGDSDEEFFAEIARQTERAHAAQPVAEPTVGSRVSDAYHGLMDVVGAPKRGVDWVAQQAGFQTAGEAALHNADPAGWGTALEHITGTSLGLPTLAGNRARQEQNLAEVAQDSPDAARLLGSAGAGVEALGMGLGEALTDPSMLAIPSGGVAGKVIGAAFLPAMAEGAIEGLGTARDLYREAGNRITPEATTAAVGGLVSAGFGGLTGLHLAGGLMGGMRRAPKPTDAILERGLRGLEAKGEIAPGVAQETLAREQGGAPPPKAAQPAGVVPEPQPAPVEPIPPQTPPQEPLRVAAEAPPVAQEPLSAPPRVEVAAPPPEALPAPVEALQPVEAPPPALAAGTAPPIEPLPLEAHSAEAPPSADAAPPANPSATQPVESLDAWAERIEPLKALGFTPEDIVSFSRESNGLAHVDDIIGRGRPKGTAAPQTRFGGKARDAGPPTAPEDLESALRASLRPEELQEASRAPALPPGALAGSEGLSKAIVGEGYTDRGSDIKSEYGAKERELGREGARRWLEEQFHGASEPSPERLSKVQRASTRSLLEQVEENRSKSPASIYGPGSPAAEVLGPNPSQQRKDFVQERITKLLAQDTPSARAVMSQPEPQRRESIKNWLRGAVRNAERDAGRMQQRRQTLSFTDAGEAAARATESALQSGGAGEKLTLTGMPAEWTARIKEFKRLNDSYEKGPEGKLTEEGKSTVASRVTDLMQNLIAGFYEHPQDAIRDLAELSNIATTYSADYPGGRGTPWAALQEQLRKRIPGMEGFKGKGFENFAQQAANKLGFPVGEWVKARFTHDPDFVQEMKGKREAGELQASEREQPRLKGKWTTDKIAPELQMDLMRGDPADPAVKWANEVGFAEEAGSPISVQISPEQAEAILPRLRKLAAIDPKGVGMEPWQRKAVSQAANLIRRLENAAKPQESHRGEGLAGLIAHSEATPVEGHPDLKILNHTEARTPALDASTAAFAQEAAEPLQALYERLRGLTGAQGGTLGGFTSSTAHEGAFVGGKSYLNPSYHFSDALKTAAEYGLEGDAEVVRSIAATRAVATLEHEFLHDLGGHKTEEQFATALRELQTASRADPEFAALEKALRDSISDKTVEQFRASTPVFERLVEERYGRERGAGLGEGEIQGAGEGSPLAVGRAEPGGGERLPESGEGLRDRPRGDPELGTERDVAGAEGELAAASRHAPEDDGAPVGAGGPEAPRPGEEAGPDPAERAQGASPEELKLIAARASQNPKEIAAAANGLLHKRLLDAAQAAEGDSPISARQKVILRHVVKAIPEGRFGEEHFVKAMRRAGAPKEAAQGLWEAFHGAAEGGSSAEFQDLFAHVMKPQGWGNWKTWASIWKAGMLGVPTQVANTGSNAILQNYRDAEGLMAVGLNMLGSKATGKARERFTGEYSAGWRGRQHAWSEAAPDLWASLEKAAKLEGVSLSELEKHLGSQEDAALAQLKGPQDSKAYEFLTIPFKALQAADDFAKHMLKWEEFHREGYRSGRAKGLKGKALTEHESTMAQEMNAGLLAGEGPLWEKHRGSIDRAAIYRMKQDTLQAELGPERGWISGAAAAINRAKSDLPPLEVLFPFTKTPANATIEALMRTPYGFRKVYKAWKSGEYKADPARFYDELAKPMLGTAIMGGIMTQMLGKDFITGQGPEDPKQQALKRETGWQPYSFHIGDKYIPYNRVEPLASVLGIAADMKEALASGQKTTAQVKLKLALSSIGKNLLNKSFLSQLSGAMQAGSDPIRFGPQFAKQLTSSLVPNVAGVIPVGNLASAIDPTFRKTTVLTAPLAKIPGVSRFLPEQETALGTPRERTGGEGILGGLQRLLLPSQITTVRTDVGARVAGELDRLSFPIQPPRDHIVIQGKRIDLSKAQREKLQEAQFKAVNHMSRMIQDKTYQGMPDGPDDAAPGQKSKEYMLKKLLERYREPIMNEIKARARQRGPQAAGASL